MNSINGAIIAGFGILTYCCLLFFVILGWGSRLNCVIIDWEVFSLGSTYFGFPVIVDYIRLTFSFIVCYITSIVLFYTVGYIGKEYFLNRFIWLVVLFVFSINILLFVPRVWGILLGWDGLGITSFALVIYYQNSIALRAGIITALINRIGDVCLIYSICILSYNGQFIICYLWGPHSILLYGGIFIIIAGITKSAQIPFSSWLPAAIAAPTPVSALVHSSTLVTAGVFLLFRFSRVLVDTRELGYILIFISICTILIASICANIENDLKKVIAYSTLRQLGLIIFRISIGLYIFAFFHLLIHALLKALLFLCAGSIIDSNQGIQDLRLFGGIRVRLPLTTACFNLATLALCGIPFVGAFYSKDLILESIFAGVVSSRVLILVLFSIGLTISYSIRLCYLVGWGRRLTYSIQGPLGENYYICISILILIIGVVILGRLLQRIFLIFDETVFLDGFLKSLVYWVFLFSICTSYIIFSLTGIREKRFKYYNKNFRYFVTTIWFLNWIGVHPWRSKVLGSSQYFYKNLEQGWGEYLGGQGVFITLKYLRLLNQKFQNKLVITSIGIMTVGWFCFIYLYIY